MGCTFCATGQAGFTPPPRRRRGPRAGRASPRARPRRGASPTSCSWAWASRSPTTPPPSRRCGALHDGLGLSARHLTVSTVGVAPAIERLAAEGLTVTLAVSLHAANDELRDALVPLNARPTRSSASRPRVSRWTTATAPARSLRVGAHRRGERPRRRRRRSWPRSPRRCGAHVNLIALNPTPGYLVRGHPAPRRARVPRPLGAARRQRDHARDAGPVDRRRLRAARRGRAAAPSRHPAPLTTAAPGRCAGGNLARPERGGVAWPRNNWSSC